MHAEQRPYAPYGTPNCRNQYASFRYDSSAGFSRVSGTYFRLSKSCVCEPAHMRNNFLIIGAGPTGLVLALWLTKLGGKVRIIDKTAEAGTTSRALAVQARPLELYRQLDLADTVVACGHKVPAVNLWVRGEPKAHLSFETIGSDLTPYPLLQIFPQDEHERLLIARLEGLGVPVEWRTELVSFTDEGEHVTAFLRKPE